MAREPYAGAISAKVTKKNGYFDFVLNDDGTMELIRGPEEVAQAAELRLNLWQGGWCLDRSHGFPWARFLGRKDVSEELLAMWSRKVILDDERIRRVDELDVTIDPETRVATVTWSGETADGYALKHEFVAGRL